MILAENDLYDSLAAIAPQHGIPGMCAAVYHRGERSSAAYGVLSIDTLVPVTKASLFQIGSITKIFTATLVMELVERGNVDLVAPIRRYLPDLRIAGAPAPNEITVQSLLSHTSGIDGDYFVDTGRNDDAIARFVDRAEELPLIASPGKYFSYSNAGYVILGRLIETFSGAGWAMQLGRMLESLELQHWCNDPEQLLRFRAAGGHDIDASGNVCSDRTPFIVRAMEPAGARLMMSADDLLTFSATHLNGGADRRSVLKRATTHRMQTPIAFEPAEMKSGLGWGLGWMMLNNWSPFAFGHDGNTNGQSAYLRILPDLDLIVVLLTNAASTMAPSQAFEKFMRSVLRSMGFAYPERVLAAKNCSADPATVLGTYESVESTLDVSLDRGQVMLSVSTKPTGDTVSIANVKTELTQVDTHRYSFSDGRSPLPKLLAFVEADRGAAAYAFFRHRLHKRVELRGNAPRRTATA